MFGDLLDFYCLFYSILIISTMLAAAEAERLIFTLIDPIQSVESVPLAEALGRVLAAPARSELDFPHWDNSAMDGYAVRSVDAAQVPVTLQVVSEIPAGMRPTVAVGAGQAARILTGAMMPEGADTVVMQEETARSTEGAKDEVTILTAPKKGAFVRQQGSFYRAGSVLLEAGRAIAPAQVALLAAAQQTQVDVFRQARVAILSTGSELVEPGEPLGPGQIVDSNQYALAALVAQSGAVPVSLGIVPDNRAAVKAAIALALSQSDMVLSSGGVSVGDYDYVDAVLEELGATLHIRSVAVKPGKPLTVATANREVGRQLYFGLPGNPASAMIGFWRFVAPAIQRLSGVKGPLSLPFVWASAANELTAGGQRETYVWGELKATDSGYVFASAAGGHSSGNLVNLANTSGLGVVPVGQTRIEPGEPVRVLVCR